MTAGDVECLRNVEGMFDGVNILFENSFHDVTSVQPPWECIVFSMSTTLRRCQTMKVQYLDILILDSPES